MFSMQAQFYWIFVVFLVMDCLSTETTHNRSSANRRHKRRRKFFYGGDRRGYVDVLEYLRAKSETKSTSYRRITIAPISAELQGPIRNDTYDPNYGYEPYWPDGNWVWEKRPAGENGTDMCGSGCPALYASYGAICGRNNKFEHKTFVNYCELRHMDCNNKFGWSIAYRGKCRSDPALHPKPYYIWEVTLLPKNSSTILQKFQDKYPHLDLPYKHGN